MHLHIVESLLATFLIVIQLTPFPYAPGITLKNIRGKNTPFEFSSVTASAPAFLQHGTVTTQFFQLNPGNSLPTNSEPLINRSHLGLSEESAFCDTSS